MILPEYRVVSNHNLIACYETDDFAGFRKMLAEGADPNLRIDDGPYADRLVMQTVTDDRSKFTIELIEHGAELVDPERGVSVAILAVFHARQALLEYLLERFAPNELDAEFRKSEPLVLWAVRRRNHSLVHFLVEKGCDIDKRNETLKGETPLTYAVRERDVEMVALLLKLGANPLAQGLSSYTAIMAAAFYPSEEQAEILALLQSYLKPSHPRFNK